MLRHIVKILEVRDITHDVKSFRVEKPKNYSFIPGQAVDVALKKEFWEDKKRPFTLTSINSEPFLEFIIKIYKEREGVTSQLGQLRKGDSLTIEEPFGSINYRGKGVFIAGGAGITPFIAILRDLKQNVNLGGNSLIFANKTEKDIILKEKLSAMQKHGLKIINTLTREKSVYYENKRIDKEFLKEKISDFSQFFYICGPLRFVGEIHHCLKGLGANQDKIIIET